MRVGADHGFGERFDEVGQVGLGILPSQRSQQRRREDDVADEPQPYDENLEGSIVASSISMTGMSSLMG